MTLKGLYFVIIAYYFGQYVFHVFLRLIHEEDLKHQSEAGHEAVLKFFSRKNQIFGHFNDDNTDKKLRSHKTD